MVAEWAAEGAEEEDERAAAVAARSLVMDVPVLESIRRSRHTHCLRSCLQLQEAMEIWVRFVV